MSEFIKAIGIFYKNELNAIKKSGVQLQPVYEAFSNAWESIEERFHGELMHHGVLEIAECTKMKIQQNCHDFTVGQRCCTPSTLHYAIVFQQISCIFCIKMFAKLVYNTK